MPNFFGDNETSSDEEDPYQYDDGGSDQELEEFANLQNGPSKKWDVFRVHKKNV